MAGIAGMNFEEVILRGLQGNLQDQIYEKLVAERMEDLEKQVRVITRAEVEKYTIESITKFRDNLAQMEEIRILIAYKEKNS